MVRGSLVCNTVWAQGAALQDDATLILGIVKGYGKAIELLEIWMAVNCGILLCTEFLR